MDAVRYRHAERQLWSSEGLAPSERELDLRRTGGTVRVQEVGEGPPVLFVHGALNAGTSWAPLVARLPGVRGVLLDRPGCGLSSPLSTGFDDIGRLESFADALVVDVLDALDLETASVVATSFGGYLALRAAAAHPERIERVVEIGWTIGAPIARTPLVMRLANVPGLGRLMAAVPPTRAAVRAMLRQIGLRGALDRGRFTEAMLDWCLSLLRDTDTMRNELAAGPRVIRPLRGLDERVLLPDELLARIAVPVGFVWGEGDPFGGAETARGFAALIRGARLELLAGAGHAPWIDEPDQVAAITRRFLEV